MESPSDIPALAARAQEQLLIDRLDGLPPGRLVCNTAGRGQFAHAYALQHSESPVCCWSLDLYLHELIAAAISPRPDNLTLCCQADLPDEPVDGAALLVSKQGDGELMRDLLQQMCLRLVDGGTLLAATDNPHDTWLGEQLDRLFAKIVRRSHPTGVVYQALRQGPPKKIKHYDAQFELRDDGSTLTVKTRPGVFSHRELDGGARALLKALHVEPGSRVLDIGCGSGALALAAAERGAQRVQAIDSNARSVDCVTWSAAENELPQLTATLDCDGRTVERGAFDLALANPPYFANYRIAELFSRIAAAALRPLGQLVVVTKTPQWYVDRLPELGFEYIDVVPAKNYVLVCAVRVAEADHAKD